MFGPNSYIVERIIVEKMNEILSRPDVLAEVQNTAEAQMVADLETQTRRYVKEYLSNYSGGGLRDLANESIDNWIKNNKDRVEQTIGDTVQKVLDEDTMYEQVVRDKFHRFLHKAADSAIEKSLARRDKKEKKKSK